MNTADLEQSIILIGNETPTDLLLSVGDKIAALGEFLRDIKSKWEAKMIERIEQDGPIVVGDIRYYVGNEKDTKCNDVRQTTEACMDAAAGDLEAFNGVLSSNAFKPGACRKLLLPEKFAELFTTTEKLVLKDGVAVPQLQKVNAKFIR